MLTSGLQQFQSDLRHRQCCCPKDHGHVKAVFIYFESDFRHRNGVQTQKWCFGPEDHVLITNGQHTFGWLCLECASLSLCCHAVACEPDLAATV